MIRPIQIYTAHSKYTVNNSNTINTQNNHNNVNFTGICNHVPGLYQGSDCIIYNTKMDDKTSELYKTLRNKIAKTGKKNLKEGISYWYTDNLPKKYQDIKRVKLDDDLDNGLLHISLIYKDYGIRRLSLTDDNRIIIKAEKRSKSCKSHDNLVDKILFEIGNIKKQEEKVQNSDNKEAQKVISLLLSLL